MINAGTNLNPSPKPMTALELLLSELAEQKEVALKVMCKLEAISFKLGGEYPNDKQQPIDAGSGIVGAVFNEKRTTDIILSQIESHVNRLEDLI